MCVGYAVLGGLAGEARAWTPHRLLLQVSFALRSCCVPAVLLGCRGPCQMRATLLPHCDGAAVSLRPGQQVPTAAELASLRTLLARHSVLLVRGCPNLEAFAALCRGLGPLFDDVNGPGRGRPELKHAGKEVHYISNIDLATDTAMRGPTSMLSEANSDWHSDYSWMPSRPRFTALYGLEVSAGGGAKTQIASTRRGYEMLPAPLKEWCVGKMVVHRPGGLHAEAPAAANFAGTDHTAAGLRAAAARLSVRKETELVREPIVDNHSASVSVRRPLLLRGALLLGRHAMSVEDDSSHEAGCQEAQGGAEVLQQLTKLCVRESLVYTHKWVAEDVLIWDNEATLHRAVPGESGQRRHLARTVIASLYYSDDTHDGVGRRAPVGRM